MMKVYIAGRMRGIPGFNFKAFDEHAEVLRGMGHETFSPAERDRKNGFDPTQYCGWENLSGLGFDLRDALCDDLKFICLEADAIVVLDGWETSKGARAEVATARALGLPVLRLEMTVSDYLLVEVTNG